MATLSFPTKDPQDLLDYTVDITRILGTGSSDTITTAVWTVPSALTKTAETVDGTQVQVWLDGGTPGVTHQLHVTITTSQGRRIDRDILLPVAEL